MTAALFAFAETGAQAARLADALGVACHEISVHRFPDGESLVRVEPSPRTALLYRSLDDANAKLVEILLAASALRANGAARVMLIAPYLGYMRQDRAFHRGEAVSQSCSRSGVASPTAVASWPFEGIQVVARPWRWSATSLFDSNRVSHIIRYHSSSRSGARFAGSGPTTRPSWSKI